jgi:hypothetical protein
VGKILLGKKCSKDELHNVKKVIFIGSAPRSGSTILDMMLGNGEGCFSLSEVNAFYRPYRKHHWNSICPCGNVACKIRKGFENISEKDLYDYVFDELGMHTAIDSSKDLSWIIDQNMRLADRPDIRVYNILIFKQPVSLAYSFYKRGYSLDKYKKHFNYYAKFLQTGMPFISVEYSALAQDPAGLLKRICEYIEIPYFEGKEEYWNKEMHHFFGSGSVIRTYNSENPQIKSREQFSEDFLPHIAEIERDFNQDERRRKTLDMLNQFSLESGQSDNFSGEIRKPLWYYGQKIRAVIKKRFPDEYREFAPKK